MRSTFSQLLASAAALDERVLLLTGDHGYALFDEFRRVRPKQFINCGIAEQNMVGVAAGLAKVGFKPIVYGLSAFVPMRVLEQIKMDICYENLPVMLVGDGAGVVYSHLGASHQCTEDIAALRAIPNIDIYSPADRFELELVFEEMLSSMGASYLRFGKADCGDIHECRPRVVRDPVRVRTGADRVMLATGSMVSVAVKVADLIGNTAVFSVPALSFLSPRHLLDCVSGYSEIFTLEEHSVFGGFGSAVIEMLSETGVANVHRIGIEGRFSELCGSYAYLMASHGLDVESVKSRVLSVGKNA